jgi:small subunit ribosomal protein S8
MDYYQEYKNQVGNMIHTDKLSILFNKLENSINQNKEISKIKYLKFYEEILKTLRTEGVIKSYSITNGLLIIILNSTNLFNIKITRISKPGRRIYNTSKQIANKTKNLEIFYLISTSKGIMSNSDASLYGIGGEVLSEIKYIKCL